MIKRSDEFVCAIDENDNGYGTSSLYKGSYGGGCGGNRYGFADDKGWGRNMFNPMCDSEMKEDKENFNSIGYKLVSINYKKGSGDYGVNANASVTFADNRISHIFGFRRILSD